MYCNKCGTKMEDHDRFCPACGAPNARMAQQAKAASEPASGTQATADAQPTTAQPTTAQTAPTFDWSGSSQPAGSGPVAAHPKGCLAQAFDDITKVPGALQRVLKIAFVPGIIAVASVVLFIIPMIGWVAGAIGLILAWCAGICAEGYAIEWGRELSRGRGFDTKAPLLRTSLFSLGFFGNAVRSLFFTVAFIPLLIFIAFLTLTTGTGILSALFGGGYSSGGFPAGLGVLVLLILILATIVLAVLFTMFGDAAVMHMAVTGRVESTFALGKVARVVKSTAGKLFCASILSRMLVGIAMYIVLMILMPLTGSMFESRTMYSVFGNAVEQLFATIPLVICVAAMVFVVFCAAAFTSVLVYRALGYWAQRYAPAWIHEGESDFVFTIPGTEGRPVV